MSRGTKDESRLSGLPPYLINAFDLVLNVKSFDRKKELKESCLSTLHLFAGHLVNNRIQEEINEKNGIPNEKSNTMSPEQLIKYIDSLATHTLPICPEPITNLLRNYDQMLNVSYSQLRTLILLVRSHALLLGKKIVTEFDFVSIVMCFENLAGDNSAFDFKNDKDNEALREVLSAERGSEAGIIFKTIKEY